MLKRLFFFLTLTVCLFSQTGDTLLARNHWQDYLYVQLVSNNLDYAIKKGKISDKNARENARIFVVILKSGLVPYERSGYNNSKVTDFLNKNQLTKYSIALFDSLLLINDIQTITRDSINFFLNPEFLKDSSYLKEVDTIISDTKELNLNLLTIFETAAQKEHSQEGITENNIPFNINLYLLIGIFFLFVTTVFFVYKKNRKYIDSSIEGLKKSVDKGIQNVDRKVDEWISQPDKKIEEIIEKPPQDDKEKTGEIDQGKNISEIEQKLNEEPIEKSVIEILYYSIPEPDGRFMLAKGKNEDDGRNYYRIEYNKVSKQGHVFLLEGDGYRRALNNWNTYLYPVSNFVNINNVSEIPEARTIKMQNHGLVEKRGSEGNEYFSIIGDNKLELRLE